jgi:hypothetical protein
MAIEKNLPQNQGGDDLPTIMEAKRYLENARELLSEKGGKKGSFYTDRKYIKMAGHTLYCGVLIALDVLLGNKKKGRKSVEWYQTTLAKSDRNLLRTFNAAYATLHLALGYDGNPNVSVVNNGLKLAYTIVNDVELRTQQLDALA